MCSKHVSSLQNLTTNAALFSFAFNASAMGGKLREGTRVQPKAKAFGGKNGIVVQRNAYGTWKVKLDDGATHTFKPQQIKIVSNEANAVPNRCQPAQEPSRTIDRPSGTDEQSRPQPGFVIEEDEESRKGSISDLSENGLEELLSAPTPPRPPPTYKGITAGTRIRPKDKNYGNSVGTVLKAVGKHAWLVKFSRNKVRFPGLHKFKSQQVTKVNESDDDEEKEQDSD